MKALLRTLLPVLIVAVLPACHTPAKYQKNRAATHEWLTASAGTSRLNIEGSWYAEDWGHGHLAQNGNKVTGHIGRYPVHGVINGTTMYLAATDEGWTSYTIVVKYARPGVLEGYYSDYIPYSDKDREPIVLVRSHR